MSNFGFAKLESPPSIQAMTTQLLPIASFAAGTLYFGNVAYLHLPVSIYSIRKEVLWREYVNNQDLQMVVAAIKAFL